MPEPILRLIAAAFAALLLSSCATAPPPQLARDIDAAISRPPFDRALWAIRIEEENGGLVYERSSTKLMMPASNRKLFAAATIANCLGLDTRLETTIWRDGDDLVLQGGGDPSLGSWRYERDGDFDAVADALRARGITSLRDLVVDVSAFDRVTIPGGWKHGNLGEDYAAPVDAITWGESEIAGDRSVPDAAAHAGEALRAAFALRGIEVRGTTRVVTEPRRWQERLLSLPSPFVVQLLTTVLENSHNLYTEMLYKRASDGTYESSFALERDLLLRDLGLTDGTFRFVDGSGLAPDDLITPEAAIGVLRWMDHPLRRGLWWSILARPGETGTLRRRLAGLEGRLVGKTGTINGVNALSGILAMPDGRHRFFSIIVNHHVGDGDAAVEIIDEVVRMAAR